jgi:hypothetical protein
MINVRQMVVMALVASVVGVTLLGYLATASAVPPPAPPVDLLTSPKRPVAGEVFRGLAIVNRSPDRFSWVDCNAQIAGKRLFALKHFFVPSSRVGSRQVVVCGWRIPRGAAGETLYQDDADGVQYGGTTQGLAFEWTVKKR